MVKEYEKFDELYQYSMTKWGEWQAHAMDDLRFYLGLQWNTDEQKYLKRNRRNAYVFNRVHRLVKFITGYQRKNRLSFKVNPVESSDNETASQQSQVLQQGIQRYNGYNILSEAFEQGCLKTGLNVVVPYLDYSDDVLNGDVKLARVPFTKIMIDPNFTERDLGNADFILRREMLTKDAAKAIFPKRAKDIEGLHPRGRDDKFINAANIGDSLRDGLLRYDEYWQRKYILSDYVVDTRTFFKTKWTGTKRDLKRFLDRFPQFVSIEQYEKNVNLQVFIEEQDFFDGLNPGGLREYPHVPVMGFFDSEYDIMEYKLQSIIRCMKDPAIESNKRRSQMLDIMESIINTGWVAEENSVVNEDSLYQSGQGKVVYTKTGAQKPERINPPEVPAGIFQSIDLMDRDQMEIPGANNDIFGVAERDIEISYVLAKLRQSSSITILQDIFDNYRYAKKVLGEKVLSLMKLNYTPEKVQRITGRPPTPDFFEESGGRYDISVTEGVLTDTQKQMHYLQLADMRKNLGVNIPDEAIIDAAPLERKDELLRIIKQSAQAAQEANKINLMAQQAEIQADQARAAKDAATAEQKKAQAKLNEAQAASALSEIGNKEKELQLNEAQMAISLVETLTAPQKQLAQR